MGTLDSHSEEKKSTENMQPVPCQRAKLNNNIVLVLLLFVGYHTDLSAMPKSEKVIIQARTIFPPLIGLDPKTQRCLGKSVTKVEKMLQKAGFVVNTICMPAARVYRSIQQGDADVTVNLKSTPALKGHVSFSSLPFTNLSVNLYTLNSGLTDKHISSVRGFGYGGKRELFTKDGYRFIDFADTEASIRFFFAGRVRHLMAYDAPFKHYANALKTSSDFSYQSKTIYAADSFLAVSKKSRFHDELLAYFYEQENKKSSP